MRKFPRKRVVMLPAILGTLLACAASCRADAPAPCTPRCLDDLRKLNGCQLADLFARATLNAIPTGHLDGEVLHVCNKRLPRIRVWGANLAWRGKHIDESCSINRWIGGHQWIASNYTVGPSWFDGQPAMLIEYAPGTPLFANMHDEIREICPGLYIGIMYERCPCPQHIGFLGLQAPCVCK